MAAWDKSACAGCCTACDDSRCWGSGSTRATGLGEVGNTAAWAGEASGGLAGIADELGGPDSPEESEGTKEGGGGFGTAVAETRSRFVVRGRAMATGGGVIGPVCVTVI
jgi:hypothetical protein